MRRVLVTGSSRGIGRAIAERLAQCGFSVTVHCRSNRAQADELAARIGSAVLQFDATGDREFLELARARTVQRMAPHLTHMGVHDHGFNNLSTYGNLRRLMREGHFLYDEWEMAFY